MKVVTWNVNSLNARQEYVSLFLDAVQPDVLAIQELKLPDERVPVEMFEERGYHVALHGQPRWNGVLIASKAPITEPLKGLAPADEGQARLVSGVIDGIRYVNLYCPQGQAVDSPKFPYKLRFFDALIEWLGEHCPPDAPAVVLGDINIAPAARDLYDPEGWAGVPSFHPDEHARWARMVALGFHDVVAPRVPPNTYSFWDYRGGAFYKNRGLRIDHLLVTAPLLDRVTAAWVERDWRKKKGELKASDHAPVCIELG